MGLIYILGSNAGLYFTSCSTLYTQLPELLEGTELRMTILCLGLPMFCSVRAHRLLSKYRFLSKQSSTLRSLLIISLICSRDRPCSKSGRFDRFRIAFIASYTEPSGPFASFLASA